MKNILTVPLALSLAAAPFWCGLARAQESAAPPDPAPSPHVIVKAHPSDADEETDEPPRITFYRQEDGKRQRVTFLGVNTAPLPEAVAAQLPVEKGTGLLVTFVAKDSPAAKAGLEPNDVLVKLDEHILVNVPQLQTVIENRKEGDPVTLAFYRKGQEKSASATLASQEKSAFYRATSRSGWGDGGDPARNADFQMALVRAQEDAKHALGDAKLAIQSARSEIEKQKGEWALSMSSLKEALKGIELPSDGLTTTFSRPGSAQALTLDQEGIFLLTRRENTVHLRATDKSGKVLFDGNVTTPQEQAGVPAALSAKLQKLLKDFPMDTQPAVPPVPPAPAAPAAPAPPAT